jgi:hypothetical protein
MIDAKMIPDDVVEVYCAAYLDNKDIRAALAAALAAWPNATKDELEPGDEPFLILPLPKDAADE